MIFGKRFVRDATKISKIKQIIEDTFHYAEIHKDTEIISDIYREALFEIKDLVHA